jgi:hypothetical protein
MPRMTNAPGGSAAPSSPHSRRAVLAALGALAAAGCAAPPAPTPAAATLFPPPPPAPPAPPLPPYLARLAELGVDWTPPPRGPAILVNAPSFELVAFLDREPVLTSRVIVGDPRTPTPIGDFGAAVVRFRPTWRPTPRMVREGLYEDGVREAGPGNPLGLAAIRFAEGGDIYLHGTNKPKLFQKDGRALSSGCVRVERIEELAALTLGWDLEAVRAQMHGRRTWDAPTAGAPVRIGHHLDFGLPGEPTRSHPPLYV